MRENITEHDSTVEIQITDFRGNVQIVPDVLTISVSRSLDTLAGSGSFTVRYHSNIRWSGLANLRIRVMLVPEDRARGAKSLLNGFITSVSEKHTAQGPTVSVTVSDKTIDLLQCHPLVHPPKNLTFGEGEDGFTLFNIDLLTPPSWGKATLGEIVKDYCKPFNISVVDETNLLDNTLFEGHTTDENETVWNTIHRLCTSVGVTPYTNERGQLVLGVINAYYRKSGPYKNVQYTTNPPAELNSDGAYVVNSAPPSARLDPLATILTGNPVASQQGYTLTHDDVLELTHTSDFSNRFSDYKTIVGVDDAGGRDDPDANKGSYYAYDERVGRWRPYIESLEDDYRTQLGEPRQYANWMMRKQRGDSQVITVKLRYWNQIGKTSRGGEFLDTYAVGELINLNLPRWRKKGQMVISDVNYQLTGAAHRTLTLTLKSLDTYAPVPVSNVFYNWIDRPSNINNIIGPQPKSREKSEVQKAEDKYYADNQKQWGNEGKYEYGSWYDNIAAVTVLPSLAIGKGLKEWPVTTQLRRASHNLPEDRR